MAGNRKPHLILAGGVLLVAGACAPNPAPEGLFGSSGPAATGESLSALPPSPPPPPTVLVTTMPEGSAVSTPRVRSVTLSAANADVRALIPALAEAAELSVVIGPEVEGRVTVNFVDMPADEALRLVLAEAGLMIEQPPVRSPWAPVVFYTLPINIDTAELDLMRERYDISTEMAHWLVQTRVR